MLLESERPRTVEPGFDSAVSEVEMWLARCAGVLAQHSAQQRLPLVSSALSCRLPARTHDHSGADAPAFEQALKSMVKDHQQLFARTLVGKSATLGPPSRPRVRRVLSLCTGFDAVAEVGGLLACFGPLEHYTSIELDAEACKLNRELLTEAPKSALAGFAVVQGDVRGTRKVAEVCAAHGPFDACIVIHPPVGTTAYGNRRGEWLKPRADRPVTMDLLCMRELGIIECPLLAVVVEPWELAMLQAMGMALGMDVRQASATPPRMAKLRRRVQPKAGACVDLGKAYANFGRHALVVD